jgi:toxin-antitoxin system PIN domain toxin
LSQTVDVNPLLYAANRDSPDHDRALQLVHFLAAGPELVVLFWPVLLGYVRIATHPSIFPSPLSHSAATANVDALLSQPHIRVVGEGERFWSTYRQVAIDVRPRGNSVPDAQLVALMIEHGVSVIWSRDRAFRKYQGITVRDPFADRYKDGFA